jgi:DNA adenine methylase
MGYMKAIDELIGLEQELGSSDSMAWSFPLRFAKGDDSLETADEYLERVKAVLCDYVQIRAPATAGAGNGQGRKPAWNNQPTTAIRVPAVFADRLVEVAREWDALAGDFVQNQLRTYDGGKGQEGVFQRIINQMPPHDVYIEAFLGAGAVMRAKRPARISYGVELDPRIVEEWKRADLPSLRLYCGDAIRFLKRFPWSGSELVYCDPTYLRSTRSYQGEMFRYEMTDEQHEELLQVIKRIPARVIISGYWSEMYADALRGWRTVSFPAVKRNGEKATEWLWCNFPEPLELHDYRYLGKDFRERERIKRKRQRWEKKLREMPALEAHAIAAAIETVREERRGLVTAGHTVGAVPARTSSDMAMEAPIAGGK